LQRFFVSGKIFLIGGIVDMDKNSFVELTTNLYNLTLLFPKKDPLRYQIRQVGNDIFANLVTILRGDVDNPKTLIAETQHKLAILDGFFKVAKSQNWVSPNDILELQREYSKIRGEIEEFGIFKPVEVEKKTSKKQKKSATSEANNEFSLNERQEKILEILKQENKIQVHNVKDIFPDVSKRTLRRDFESLLKHGLVERIGERNNTFYRLSNRTEDRTEVS
jgi:DNA-binding transcriptional ArsR family regulator